MGFGVRPGCSVDLLRSASGRVLLAFQDRDDRLRMFRECGVKPLSSEALRIGDDLDRLRAAGREESESSRVRDLARFSSPAICNTSLMRAFSRCGGTSYTPA